MHDERQDSIGIAELARRAGVTPRTIRYYVTEGLLPAPAGQGQRRAYGQAHLDRLEAIRELKAAYLPLHEIRRRLGQNFTSQPPLRDGEGERDGDRRASKPDGAASRGDAGRLGLQPDGAAGRGDAGRLGLQPDGDGSRKPAPTESVIVGAGFQASTPPMDPSDLPVSSAATPCAMRPIGFGPSQGVGRIEIYEPTETAWRRHVLAQGVELHVRDTNDPKLAEAIQRLLREAAAILDGTSGR